LAASVQAQAQSHAGGGQHGATASGATRRTSRTRHSSHRRNTIAKEIAKKLAFVDMRDLPENEPWPSANRVVGPVGLEPTTTRLKVPSNGPPWPDRKRQQLR